MFFSLQEKYNYCGSISRLSSVRLILSSTNFVPTKVQVLSNVSYYSRLVSRKTERLLTFAEYFLFIVTRFNETFISQNETLVSRNEVFVLRAGGNLHFSVLQYDFSGQVKVPASNVDCPNACLVCVNPSLLSFRFFFLSIRMVVHVKMASHHSLVCAPMDFQGIAVSASSLFVRNVQQTLCV